MNFFTPALLYWHTHHNHRALPWKGISDPYKIWLSEIILQQTRAEQGRPYYERFTETYPTIHDLARAPEDEVFRLWQGLGYYNRCRNLLATARVVSDDFSGKFPETYDGLLQLKGIGPYTAAAIASFAFGEPHAVADGNVYRVLARYFGIYTSPATPEGKTLFSGKATELLDKTAPAQWNQAIMDLGATVCTPQNPVCGECPLQSHCYAYQNNAIGELPTRIAKAPLKQRFLHYLILEHDGEIWLSRNEDSGIWRGLYQPFLIESTEALDSRALAAHPDFRKLGLGVAQLEYEGHLHRKLTHQALDIRFFRVQISGKPALFSGNGVWVRPAEIVKLPLPKPIATFFEKKAYF